MHAYKHTTASGKEIKLYSVQMFAVAINRDRQTVKRWERDGIIPKAPFERKRGKTKMRLYPDYFVKAVGLVIKSLGMARGKSLDKIISKAKIYEAVDKFKKEGGY